MALYIGLMSGTSLDGVDGVLVEFATTEGPPITLRAHHHQALDGSLRCDLLALNSPGDNELHRAELAANAIGRTYAEVVSALLHVGRIEPGAVRAVGAHGQTVRHRPGAFDGTGYTVQLLNAALLAERTGIDVVADLRRRDVAAGGQGAPLAPGLHAALFARPGQTRAVLNLGGIANLTVLGADSSVVGFDCGPAGALLDGWCQRHHRGQPFDDGGRWAASGRVNEPLLAAMLAEPYFGLVPPKSTGRDLFSMVWLDGLLQGHAGCASADVQATLTALTIESIARDMWRHARAATLLAVCGGGAHNTHLMQGLAERLPGVQITTTDELGLPVEQVEAVAFAWLAHRFCERRPGNLPSVTGASGPRLLGTLHPA